MAKNFLELKKDRRWNIRNKNLQPEMLYSNADH